MSETCPRCDEWRCDCNRLMDENERLQAKITGTERERDRAEQSVKELLRDDDEDDLRVPCLGDLLSYLNHQPNGAPDLYRMVKDTGRLVQRLKNRLDTAESTLREIEQAANLRALSSVDEIFTVVARYRRNKP
jgi:hypothetical protein